VSVDLGNVDRALFVNGDRVRIVEPLDAVHNSAIACVRDEQVIAFIDDVEHIVCRDEQARWLLTEVGPLVQVCSVLIMVPGERTAYSPNHPDLRRKS
jgi:hypothetical protein